MAAQMWLRDDIAQALAALAAAHLATVGAGATPVDYQRGFEDALSCVAVAFGVRLAPPETPPAKPRSSS